MKKLQCRLCGKKIKDETRAWAPSLKFFFDRGVGLVGISAEVLAEYAYHGFCARQLNEQPSMRANGDRLFPIQGTVAKAKELLDRRRVEEERRSARLAAEAARLQAVQFGRRAESVQRPFVAVLAPAKTVGSDGRRLAGAAAGQVVKGALKPLKTAQAQAAAGDGQTRAERKAARRAKQAAEAERAQAVLDRLAG